MAYIYDSEYAKHYIENTLQSPYTVYKNQLIAQICQSLDAINVMDLGGNVSGIINSPGSLKHQLQLHNINYSSLDLVPAYFDRNFAHKLGVDDETVYQTVSGVVGDIQKLPLAPNSIEMIISADVIEHVKSPDQALSEICRVLKPNGHAVIVVPSLYKLDALQAEHIDNKRYSSHENKLNTPEWISMIQESGMVIDSDRSRPLGILSGLLYVLWLDERFVPYRKSQADKEYFSKEAKQFKAVKNMVSKYDQLFDKYLLANPRIIKNFSQYIDEGNIKGLISLIKEILNNTLGLYEAKMFSELLSVITNDFLNEVALAGLKKIINQYPTLFIGNSTLFVLSKNAQNKN